ncbi:BnaA09g55420D [Brassica napus]|uniref:BnaA09g55420D protein n=1 Tax=Brassica napus TaxID=3708 RepID=A0A078JGL6_BRANA|nr:BnaA09g55420D [Brassica napus]
MGWPRSSPQEQVASFNYWREFIEKDSLLEKLSPEAPIYVIMEGGEPSFFTRFFTSWDSSKSSMHGNSFQRKLKIVKNGGLQLQINQNEELQPHMVVVPVFLKTHSSGQEPCL